MSIDDLRDPLSGAREGRRQRRQYGPLPIRALNRLVGATGLRVRDLGIEAVTRRAERATGFTDWGKPDYLERLRESLGALARDDKLNPLGELSAAIIFHWYATNRLQIVDYLKRHPQVVDIPIEKPVFITGWYRTGTTSLHNLMSLDPRSRVPATWELGFPIPVHLDAARDRRIRRRRIASKWRLADWIAPDQKFAHELRVDPPEECFFLLANAGISIPQIMGLQGYDYASGLLEHSQADTYRDMRIQYQILAHQRDADRWVMKCPMHLWFLDELMEVFPDARIVQTHRPAAEAIPSLCSLASLMSKPFTRDFDGPRHGAFFEDYFRRGIDRAMVARKTIPAEQLLDVRASDLGRDPVGTVRGVYEHFDLPWDAGFMPGAIAGHLSSEKLRLAKRGRGHCYTAEEFGLDRERLSSKFADYEEVFLDDGE
ncbi:MAG: sulfotransferase [Deltaproteobacteria bacterium]|nr:sulfotransferase [Deltaproteobacteria bacterium]